MKPVLAFSAPANLLLMGEYAITLEGGRGVSVAVEPRARATLLASEHVAIDGIPDILRLHGSVALEVVALMGTEANEDESTAPLRDAVCVEYGLPSKPGPDGGGTRQTDHDALRLIIDTSEFFDPDTGEKRGLGSSAVASLLATAVIDAVLGGVLEIAPGKDRSVLLARVIPRAIAVHRALHDGRGSGYDVATSAIGGFVAFTGGANPSAHRIAPASESDGRDVSLYTISTGRPVNSATAVRRFEDFVDKDERKIFLDRSNELAAAFEAARRWCDLFSVVESARHLSEEIGETIGVGATLPFNSSHRDDGWIAKASGAGNERAVILSKRGARRPLPGAAELLRIDRQGLRREDPPR